MVELKNVTVSYIIEFDLELNFGTFFLRYLELFINCIGVLLAIKVRRPALIWFLIDFRSTPKEIRRKIYEENKIQTQSENLCKA